MGPSRTRDPGPSANPSGSQSKLRKQGQGEQTRRPKPNDNGAEPNGVPGVQKLKSQLRQTRRLLAKDNLAADVRVETERRLKSLEADLEMAERTRKERAFAVRYHKIKFFERQKVVRKISQTKKKLSAKDLNSRLRRELETALRNLRVDLNYILHYPKLQKYISLFPPEVRHGETPQPELEEEKAKTDTRRAELRASIRKKMRERQLSREPELEKDSDPRCGGRSNHDRSKRSDGPVSVGGRGKKGGNSETETKAAKAMHDDFFGEDESGEEDDDVSTGEQESGVDSEDDEDE